MSDEAPVTLGIDPIIFEELGRGIALWSYLETVLAEFLSWLLQANPGRMYAVTQTVAASTITSWIRVLSPIHFPDDAERDYIASILAEIDDARADRNAFVHGVWTGGPVPSTALVRTIRWERREVMKDELVTLQDLKGFTERASELYRSLVVIGRRLGFHPKIVDE